MSPFRLFGPPPEPNPYATPDDTGGVTWAPGPWALTRRPRRGTPGRSASTPAPAPAVRRRPADRSARVPAGSRRPTRAWPVAERPRPPVEPPPDPREAAALAGAFAADYLSWDEDDPGRRGRVLADHVAAPAGDPALLGWDGMAGSGRSSRYRERSGRTATTGVAASGCGSLPTGRWPTAQGWARARAGRARRACRRPGALRAGVARLRLVLGAADRSRGAGGRAAGGRRRRRDPARRRARPGHPRPRVPPAAAHDGPRDERRRSGTGRQPRPRPQPEEAW